MKPYLNFLCIVFFTLMPLITNGGTIGEGRASIFADNKGSAQSQALKNAQRDAVEKGVGLLLDSKTLTENWKLVEDEVFMTARGFIKSYNIITNTESPDGKEWLVTIDAEVAAANIKTKLEELRILHQKMGNKRVAVVYHPMNPNALQKATRAVIDTKAAIQETFNSSGFRLFHLSQSGEQESTFKDSMNEAKDKSIDMLVEFDLFDSSPAQTQIKGIYVAKVEVNLNIWDLATNRQISSVQNFKKQFLKGFYSKHNWDTALAKAGIKAGKEATKESITKIVQYYQEIGDIGNSFLIDFTNYTEDETDQILNSLENMEGFQSLNELTNKVGYVQIEYFSSLKKSRLRRLLRTEIKKMKIVLQSKNISGNRLSFIKPGTE